LKRYIPDGFLFLVLLYLFTGYSGFSDTVVPVPEVRVTYNWENRTVFLDLAEKMDLVNHTFPEARSNADRNIRKSAADIFIRKIMNLYVDSLSTIKDRVKNNQLLFNSLLNASQYGTREFSYVSGNMDTLNVRYEYQLFGNTGIAGLFINHKRPYPVERFLGFVPSRNFSGLVIYAKGKLPLFGKSGTGKLKPALFLRIFDEDMNIIAEKEMCRVESLKRWGIAAYTGKDTEAPFLKRIGMFPLRVKARGIYGENNTDIIISVDAGRKLLSRDKNIDLLRNGRILVILDLD